MRSHHLRAAAGASSGGIITTNLERYYDFGDTNSYNPSSNNRNVTDLSGHTVSPGDNNAQWNAAPTYNSGNGGHIILGSGQNGILTVNYRRHGLASRAGTGGFTIEMWVNVYYQAGSQKLREDAPLVIVYTSSQFTFTYYLMNLVVDAGAGWEGEGLAGTFNSYTWDVNTGAYSPSGTPNSLYTTPTFVQSRYNNTGTYQGWEHVVVTRTSTGTNGLKFYINNSLLFTGTNSINYNAPAAASGALSYGYHTATKMAIIREYTTGFTASDVAQNYNAEKARFGL